jgi:hypothetical protein
MAMKNSMVFILLVMYLNVFAQSEKDSQSIKTACIDYVEGFFTQDSARLNKALHSGLVKRIIDNRSGEGKLVTNSLSDLLNYSKPEYKIPDAKPDEPFRATIDIYDITNGIALAKIVTNKMPAFFDYVQMGKLNNEWKIINVLWAFYE